MKNSKKNNWWLSLYVLRTDWVKSHGLIKPFLFYRQPYPNRCSHTLDQAHTANRQWHPELESHFHVLPTHGYPGGSGLQNEEKGEALSCDGPCRLEGVPGLGAQLL